ncbi:hypothetical protein AB0A74_17340 [Saccharothrix sp. NPDC042600]|uniref:hypothetical protein n=1 Tax=Saccharothrix TaxID=2071 RepID=UPI0033F83C23|nr:hypothetical protein GCM10017745_29300 [Saccharothrix mutabilis subsp. capreolus]
MRSFDYRLRYWHAVRWARSGRVRDAADELRRLGEDVVPAFGVSSRFRDGVLRESGAVAARG